MPLAPLASRTSRTSRTSHTSLGPLPKSLLQLIIQRAAETSREKPDVVLPQPAQTPS